MHNCDTAFYCNQAAYRLVNLDIYAHEFEDEYDVIHRSLRASGSFSILFYRYLLPFRLSTGSGSVCTFYIRSYFNVKNPVVFGQESNTDRVISTPIPYLMCYCVALLIMRMILPITFVYQIYHFYFYDYSTKNKYKFISIIDSIHARKKVEFAEQYVTAEVLYSPVWSK